MRLLRPEFPKDNAGFFKESTSWPRLAKIVSAKILTSAALQRPRGKVDEAYNQTARNIVNELKNTWFR
ncbi:hypothetical protein AAVH_29405 [Aphelenchoides avenae]|nr:hypothetical protein AAVH_29405 [Aphelenchus avenae]